jgi:hypothetical protein
MGSPLATALELDIRSGQHPSVGEMGVLENIQRSTVDPNACYLIMNHADAWYVARLNFDHEGFCNQLCDLLPRHYGRSFQEIGKLRNL